ncbi:Serine/threonine protein kinase [Hyella patelloides LEGE 07179]|uniref:non-specific serine/threonine protein kinase n=1 Tax=Hyella patelloides LEGE 07179 TaxID=945734 RepID=A0A563VS67_9CYAN|nr:serine/threonine-protein kinase [Hyella patelloides]VEP14300.1 Serine/threonine protein kinase [Hyella patelloides LEGE 07179]
MSSHNSIVSKEEIPPGTLILNRYLIKQIIGQGGLGRTYLALDNHRFNELCVLKEFAPFGSGHYDIEKSRSLFKREAKILHKVNHPQIPRFLACFEQQNRLFLVQEYVKGKTYSELLEKRQQSKRVFTESEIIRWLMNLLPILSYIHKLGIIHRDISPDNIMQPPGKKLPVLIDFGVGKLTNIHQESPQNSFRRPSYVGKMSFVGKIGYAPQEQIIMGRCSPSSDIYALGVTALVLLTGKDPTALVNQQSLEWEWQKYVRVGTYLIKILSKMTEEKPLKRYHSAQEVLRDLQQFFINPQTTNAKKAIAKNRSTQSTKATPSISKPSPSQSSRQSSQQSQIDETVILPSPQVSRPPVVDDTFIVTRANSSPQEPFPKKPSTKSSSTSNSNSTHPIDSTLIVSSVNPAAPQNQPYPQPSEKSIRTKFIRRCEQELAYYIGSMAALVVQEVMQKQKPQSPEELIDAVAEYISESNQVREFKKRF